jgi:hypothetical protein
MFTLTAFIKDSAESSSHNNRQEKKVEDMQFRKEYG